MLFLVPGREARAFGNLLVEEGDQSSGAGCQQDTMTRRAPAVKIDRDVRPGQLRLERPQRSRVHHTIDGATEAGQWFQGKRRRQDALVLGEGAGKRAHSGKPSQQVAQSERPQDDEPGPGQVNQTEVRIRRAASCMSDVVERPLR